MIAGSIVFLHRIWYDGSYGNEEETDTGDRGSLLQ